MRGIKYANLLARLVDAPLLTTDRRALTLLGVLGPRAGWSPDTPILAARLMEDDDGDKAGPVLLSSLSASVPRLEGPRDDRKVYRVVDGIAVIPVEGDLVNKLGTLDPWCGMTGYDAIVFKIDEAEADPDVRGIALEINSCGGEALGCEAAGDAIRRCAKPVRALVWEAYSAAYWLASQCDRVTVTRMGGVGSVGVVTLHTDRTQQLAADGLAVTVLRAGLHKAEGDSLTPLTDDVRGRILADIEALRQIFAQAVAEGRGLSLNDVLATEAATYGAAQAVEIGLADAIATPDDALAGFIAELTNPDTVPTTPKETQSMAPKKPAKASAKSRRRLDDDADAAAPKTTPSAEDGEDEEDEDDDQDTEDRDDDQDAEDEEDEDQDRADDDADAKAKTRIRRILGSPEGQANPGLAQHLALSTAMSAKSAIATLKAGGAAVGGQGGAFASYMRSHAAGPRMGGGGAGGRGDDPRTALTAAIDSQIKAARQGRRRGEDH